VEQETKIGLSLGWFSMWVYPVKCNRVFEVCVQVSNANEVATNYLCEWKHYWRCIDGLNITDASAKLNHNVCAARVTVIVFVMCNNKFIGLLVLLSVT